MYRTITRRFQLTLPEEWREKKKIKEGDKVVAFENKEGQLVIMTLKDALDKWEENTRDLKRTIKEAREGFRKRARRVKDVAP